MYRKLLTFTVLVLLSGPLRAESQQFTSGPDRVGTLELYTSQGCSSCPPAERYLNSLLKQPGLWHEFIPMAFHVDYWDYLGWRDRFSSAQNSQRQRRYARVRSMATIYTPGFFADGREWRRRFSRGLPTFRHDKVGSLTIQVEGQKVVGEYRPSDGSRSEFELNVALLGMGLKTHIERGEREGSDTRHEFVVLGHRQQAMQGNRFSTTLPEPAVKANHYAVVVWISQGRDPTPIQAVGGMLER